MGYIAAGKVMMACLDSMVIITMLKWWHGGPFYVFCFPLDHSVHMFIRFSKLIVSVHAVDMGCGR